VDQKIKGRLTKKDILTIPNLLSLFRILLIPVIIVLYLRDFHIIAAAVVVLSGLTDIADGKIARKYNMVSDFGKFLDPVADKLTQAAMIVCLFSQYSGMIALFLLMAVRECVQFICGFVTLKKTDTMNSAKWYGKVSTVTVYAVMMVLFLFPEIPRPAAHALMTLCGIVLAGSMLLYIRFYYLLLRAHRRNTSEQE